MLKATRVGERVLVFTHGGETLARSYGANSTAVVGDDAVLLVDPLIAPSQAREVEEALVRETSRSVRHVVLTHHHSDHALGASLFARRGVPVLAHPNACERMAAEHPALIQARRLDPALRPLFEDAEAYAPDIAVGERVALDLGGLSAEVIPTGWGHTPGDLVVFVRTEGVLLTGDLVSVGYHVNLEDASLPSLTPGLDLLRALAPRSVVPGHGPVSGPGALEEQARYHETVKGAVLRGVAEGKSEEEIAAEVVALFPGYLLEILVPDSVARWREHAR